MCLSIPGRVVSIEGQMGSSLPGRISVAGVERQVDLGLVPEVSVGDYVVTHSGYAISIIPRERALGTISMLGLED